RAVHGDDHRVDPPRPRAAGGRGGVQPAAGDGAGRHLAEPDPDLLQPIPIPPLDGSHVLYHLLPARLALAYRQLGRYGMVVLLLILSLAPEVIDFLLWPVSMLDGLAAALVRLST